MSFYRMRAEKHASKTFQTKLNDDHKNKQCTNVGMDYNNNYEKLWTEFSVADFNLVHFF